MDVKEENTVTHTLDTSVSNDDKEVSDVNQSQGGLEARLQQLIESRMEETRNWMQEQIQSHSADIVTTMQQEVGRRMEEEKKSFVNSEQLQDGLEARLQLLIESRMEETKNWMQEQIQSHITTTIQQEVGRRMEEEKKSFVNSERLRVELNQMKLALESNDRHGIDTLRASLQPQLDAAKSTSESVHQLETSQYDFRQRLDKLRGQQLRTTMVLIALLIAVVAVQFTGDLKSWSHFESEPPPDRLDGPKVEFDKEIASRRFISGIDELQRTFPSQSERLWRIIEAATLPIVEEDNPLHPAVILLVAARGNTAVAECLAQRYAALVTESLNAAKHAMINCESYATSDPDDAKSHLDTVLSGSFDAGSKSAVVLRLEKLPGPAAMIFYRFAENDNAPYKNVAIVITVTLESTDTGSEMDHVAFDELRKVWASSLDADKVEPLLSRIGNSVAFVRPETKDILSENGC